MSNLLNAKTNTPGAKIDADGRTVVPIVAHDHAADAGLPTNVVLRRSVAQVRMTDAIFQDLLTDGNCIPPQSLFRRASHVVVRRGVPRDAKLIGVTYDHDRGLIVATYEHDSFEPILPGQVPPTIPVEYDLVYDARGGIAG